MITDPNEVACQGERDSPISDLRNRVALQCSLWKVVRDLRQGKYYSQDAAGFDLALNNCRSGFFDTPDLAFTRDEGTILRRLFGAFSLRPTVVSISSFSATTAGITFQAGMTGNVPVSSLAMTQVTTIPIINIRLPLDIHSGKGPNFTGPTAPGPVDLQTQLNSPDWYVENKMIVPKTKSVIFTRDIAVFYVNRRYNQINFARLTSPYALQTLPTASTGFERVNETVVELSDISIGGALFQVASIVCVDAIDLNKRSNFTPANNDFYNTKMIIGSYAYIKGFIEKKQPEHKTIPIDQNLSNQCTDNSTVKSWIVYNPRQATRTEVEGNMIQRASPVYKVSDDLTDAKKRGTIYIFEKKNQGSATQVAQVAVAPQKIEDVNLQGRLAALGKAAEKEAEPVAALGKAAEEEAAGVASSPPLDKAVPGKRSLLDVAMPRK
jgi:hypothetical protein